MDNIVTDGVGVWYIEIGSILSIQSNIWVGVDVDVDVELNWVEFWLGLKSMAPSWCWLPHVNVEFDNDDDIFDD